MSLFFGLIASSIVGSVVFITLLLFRPITSRVFSKTWHYYCLLVPLIFLLGGSHIAINLTALIPPSASVVISQIPASQEMPVGIPFEFIRPPAFDDLTVNTHVHYGGVGLTESSSVANRLMMYLESAVPFLLIIWVLGAMLFIAISTKKYLQYRRILLQNAKSVSGLYCKIPIVASATARTPTLIGVFKPMIVLPHMHFAGDELNIILAHEMVHYKRKDLLVKLMMLIANALHWFNPAVYVLNRQLNAVCELSCDEKVVSEMDTQNRIFYGETILQVLQHSTTHRNLIGNVAFATNLCNSKKNFKRRLISMMNTKRMKKSVVALALAIGLLIIGGGFVLSNMVDAAMSEYASEAAGNDNGVDVTTQSNVPSASAPQQNTPLAETQTELQESIPNNSQFQLEFIEIESGETYVIEIPERNASIEISYILLLLEGSSEVPSMPLEYAVRIGADAIYREFGFCIDGLIGRFLFIDGMDGVQRWVGNISCEELTTHSEANELFHFVINAETGEVLTLYMNTPDSPFH